ncbi:MAG: hypothetical protein ACJ72Q_21575, partial [Nitrososphaeraceae archaeon]
FKCITYAIYLIISTNMVNWALVPIAILEIMVLPICTSNISHSYRKGKNTAHYFKYRFYENPYNYIVKI